MADIGRLLTAMVTPYTSEGDVDFAGARRLARTLVDAGNDGVVVTGTTGEAPLLSDDEKARLWEEVKQELGDTATVVAGAGTNETHHSVELARRAERAGVDAVLAVAPYYLKPPQEGIYRHFVAIAEAIAAPLIVYNVPGRTGVDISLETMLRLAEVPGIVGDKEANGNLEAAAKLIEAAPGFRIWSGNDNDNFHLWCMGAYGAISVTGHLVMAQHRAMREHIDAGRIAEAAAIHRRLVPFTQLCFRNGSPSTIRYMLRQLGVPIGAPRLPVVEPDDALGAQIMADLARYTIDLPVPAHA